MMLNDYAFLLKTMPPGLDRAVLRIISNRIGKEQAIWRDELVIAVRQLGFSARDRTIRIAINRLRKQGHLICSGSSHAGYWMAESRLEFEEFKHQELESRIIEMSDTMRAMQKAADQKFGTAVQERLF